VPAGISGSLNELFDPQVVNQISFQTGGWDAEYGGKNTAVINVTTKIPAGGFHANLGSYAGAYSSRSTQGSRGFNGQTLSASTNAGPWGFYVSGTRQESDMRQEPVLFDTSASRVINFHNYGQDLFGFGKIQYSPSTRNVVSLDMNLSRTGFFIPFDSTSQVDPNSGAVTPTVLDDRQEDKNGFVNLGWRHLFGGGSEPATAATTGDGRGSTGDDIGGSATGGGRRTRFLTPSPLSACSSSGETVMVTSASFNSAISNSRKRFASQRQ
jgi:hypothetical protein